VYVVSVCATILVTHESRTFVLTEVSDRPQNQNDCSRHMLAGFGQETQEEKREAENSPAPIVNLKKSGAILASPPPLPWH
jgi:hypothetical protein